MYFYTLNNVIFQRLGPKRTNKNQTMAIKIEVKAWIHGRRRMLFERLKKKRDVSNASLVRDIFDYYFDNHPDLKN